MLKLTQNKVSAAKLLRLGSGRTLYAFDFDDTLVETDAYINVKRANNALIRLFTREFATFELQSSDVLDFDEFRQPIASASALPVLNVLEDVLSHASISDDVIVLTARDHSGPPTQWLRAQGIGVRVVAVGSKTYSTKADWLLQESMLNGYDSIVMLDDNKHYLLELEALMPQMPDVAVTAIWIV